MPKYEVTYTGFDGSVQEIVVDCHTPVNDGAFLHYALEDGTSVVLLANHRVLESRNLDEADRIEELGKTEHNLGESDGGRFKL